MANSISEYVNEFKKYAVHNNIEFNECELIKLYQKTIYELKNRNDFLRSELKNDSTMLNIFLNNKIRDQINDYSQVISELDNLHDDLFKADFKLSNY